MKKTGVKVLQGDEWQIERELVLKDKKIYMLKDEELRVEIIQLHHDVPVARYGGRWKTIKLVMRNYWWPKVIRDMGKYVDSCDMCQRIKNGIKKPAEKLKLSKISKKLWTYLIVDFITKLPLVARKDAILVVYDRLSKITYFVTTTGRMLAEGLMRLFRDNMWKLQRLPESVVLDRGL